MKPLTSKIKHAFYIWKINGNNDPAHYAASEIKALKKELRSMQRQLAAENRKQLLTDISSSLIDDRQLFYRLVRRQRCATNNSPGTVEFKKPCKSQLDGWADYFEALAKAENLPHFNDEYHESQQMTLLLRTIENEELCNKNNPIEVDERIVAKAYKGFKSRQCS